MIQFEKLNAINLRIKIAKRLVNKINRRKEVKDCTTNLYWFRSQMIPQAISIIKLYNNSIFLFSKVCISTHISNLKT